MSRSELDLKITAGIAVLAILLAAADAPTAARTGPAILLVLVLPGYALSVALLPSERDPFERILLAFGLSLCIAVLGGLLIDRLGTGLTSRSWSVGIGVFTLGACLVAARRRGAGVPDTRAPVTTRRPDRPSRRAYGLGAIAVCAAVVAVAIFSIAIARQPSSSAHVLGSTALWIKPTQQSAGTFSVGVRSDERHRMTYRVLAAVDETHRILIRTNLTVAPGEQRTVRATVPVPAGTVRTVRVSLFRAGHPAVPYRQVYATFERTAS